jgi:transposase
MPSIDADARLFTPSVPLPDSEDAVRSTVLFGVWERPWNWQPSFGEGRQVLLRRSGVDVVEWLVEVTEVVAVPFESADAFRDMIAQRWDPTVVGVHGRSPAPGFGVAWRSAPVRHLGVARPEGAGSLPEWCAFGELDERWQAALTR